MRMHNIMQEYVKILTLEEYSAIFDLGISLKGDLPTKLAILKLIQRITDISVKQITTVDGNKVLPSSIEITISSLELEGYWNGIVTYISDNKSTVENLIVAKKIAQILGMESRFEKLQSSLGIPAN